MKTLTKIKNSLKEYFLGTSIRDYFIGERAFHWEALRPREHFEAYRVGADKSENDCMMLGKYLPNVVSGLGLVAGLVTGEADWAAAGIALGETLRNLKLHRNILDERKQILKRNIKSLGNGSSLEENALEMSGHWGHEYYWMN